MMMRGRGNDKVGLRKCVLYLAAFLQQNTPPDHDLFRYRQHALIEHGTYRLRKPNFKLATPGASNVQLFDAEAKLCEGHHADIEFRQRIPCDKRQHFRRWLQPPDFRENVGIEEPCHSEHDIPDRQAKALRLDFKFPVGRGLQSGDQIAARAFIVRIAG